MTRIALMCVLGVVVSSCTLFSRTVMSAPGRGVPASEGSVRFVYVTANDIPFRDNAYAGMDRSAKRIQAWYRS